MEVAPTGTAGGGPAQEVTRLTRSSSLRQALWALICLQAVFWTSFVWVRTTNFAGFDEWLLVALLSRGVRAYPYANRPFMLWWSVPAHLLTPNGLLGYYALQAAYVSSMGWLAYLICRRLRPEQPLLALLTGTFTMVWAPSDILRLESVSVLAYPGSTCALLLAILLYVESWLRSSRTLLALGCLAAWLAARSFEAAIPSLLLAPLLLHLRERSRPVWIWVIAWEAVGWLAVGATLAPLMHSRQASYQISFLGLDLSVAGISRRILGMYVAHLSPLLPSTVAPFTSLKVWLAVSVFVLVLRVWGGRWPESLPGRGNRVSLALCMAGGFLAAGSGYSAFALSSTKGNLGTEFVSAPGIAFLLASAIALAASAFPPQRRRAAALALASWVVALGTDRTLALQDYWDRTGRYAAQHGMLVQLTQQVPDVKPGTLVVVVNEKRAWQQTFTFRNVVEYLYQGRATGYAWPAYTTFYPTHLIPDGIRSEPWPIIQEAWGAAPTTHRFDEMIAVRHAIDGRVSVLDEWPSEWTPLPAGARYDPRARIVSGGPTPPERALLAHRD